MGILDDAAAPTGRRPLTQRPEHFSTYAPRDLVLQLKVIAAVHDVPLWSVVTEALREYLERYEEQHGTLPRAGASGQRTSRGKD